MNSKTRTGIMLVIGLYLAYTGYGLIRDTLSTQPDRAWLYYLLGAVFILVGIAVAIQRGHMLWKQKIDDMNGSPADTEETIVEGRNRKEADQSEEKPYEEQEEQKEQQMEQQEEQEERIEQQIEEKE